MASRYLNGRLVQDCTEAELRAAMTELPMRLGRWLELRRELERRGLRYGSGEIINMDGTPFEAG